MKYLLVLFLAFLSVCCAPSLRTVEMPASQIDLLSDETVALVNPDNPDHAYCGGVWVGADKVLTAFHCQEDEDAISVKRRDGTLEAAVVIMTDKVDDLAMLRVDHAKSHPFAKIGRDLRLDEDLSVIGHPHNSPWTYMRGYVASVRRDSKSPNEPDQHIGVTAVAAPIWYGSSGGPAFNSRGEVVGICSMISHPGLGLFIMPATIRTFVAA